MGPYFTVLRVFPPFAELMDVVARWRHFSRIFRLQWQSVAKISLKNRPLDCSFTCAGVFTSNSASDRTRT
ncbi:hypothetical protein ASG35_28060 [Burkholderia sp. Leaf177]|nr:hypothetical protein ASG35_28060 [Burkholderia sp. Leaf177]